MVGNLELNDEELILLSNKVESEIMRYHVCFHPKIMALIAWFFIKNNGVLAFGKKLINWKMK